MIEDFQAWTSPRLQIRFAISDDSLEIYHSNGQKFLSTLELKQRGDRENDRANLEHERAERLLAQLKALGVQPD